MSEEEYFEMDIKEEAKKLLEENKTIIRYTGKEKIEEAFTKIYIPDTQEEFSERCIADRGIIDDGFNTKDYICISPDATPYTIIREVLQYLTTEFDFRGARIKNGIAQNRRYGAVFFK